MSLPQEAGATQSDIPPSFFFPLYLSLSSGTGGKKEERGKRKIKRKIPAVTSLPVATRPAPPVFPAHKLVNS
jgi:hypothetical protein